MPLLQVLFYLFLEVFLLYLWTKFLFWNSYKEDKPKSISKPFEIKLRQDNYPFDEPVEREETIY